MAVLAGATAAAFMAAPGGASAAPTDPGCTETTVISPDVSEWTCYIAPITVAGYEVKQDIAVPVPKPPVDGHITKFATDVVNENAVPIPISRLMLHHIVFTNLDRTDRTCAGAGFKSFDGNTIYGGISPERFAGAGEERAKLALPPGFGYELKGTPPTHTWGLVYMLMNHKPTTDTAYVQYKLTVDTSGTLQSVRPYWLDIKNCQADPIYNVRGLSPRVARKVAKRSGAKVTDNRSRDFTVQEDGWIVAGGGHVHGGARKLTITKPSCDNKQVAVSNPTWGLASHPFYNVKPVLHEPGPIGMSAFNTPTGIPVREGEKIRLNSLYDNLQPHTRVMGIYVVYIAEDQPGGATPQACGGAPPDTVYGSGTNLQGRSTPVPFRIPLTGLDANGNAVTIKGPPGPFKRLRSGASIEVGDRFFSQKNIKLRAGAKLTYNFLSSELHNVTLANGPMGIGSPNLNGARTFTQRFTRPGTYRLFCALHPVQMSERIIVKKRRHRRG